MDNNEQYYFNKEIKTDKKVDVLKVKHNELKFIANTKSILDYEVADEDNIASKASLSPIFEDNYDEEEFMYGNVKYVELLLPKLEQYHSVLASICRLDGNKEIYYEMIKGFPQCTSYLIYRACQCDEKCYKMYKEKIKFDKECDIFNLTDVDHKTTYIDLCRKFNLRPYYVNLGLFEFGFKTDEASRKLNMLIERSCLSKITDDTICSAFELRDECFNNKSCMQQDFVIPDGCDKDFNEIKKIIGFPIKPMLYDFNNTEYNTTLSSNDTTDFKSTIIHLNNLHHGLIGTASIMFVIILILNLRESRGKKKIIAFSLIGLIITLTLLFLSLY